MGPKKPGTGGVSKAKAKELEAAAKAQAAAAAAATTKGGKAVKGKGKGTDTPPVPPVEEEKKPPTIQEQLGCVGWTGKLPVNILNELCQKRKWRSPEYIFVRYPLYSVTWAEWKVIVLEKT